VSVLFDSTIRETNLSHGHDDHEDNGPELRDRVEDEQLPSRRTDRQHDAVGNENWKLKQAQDDEDHTSHTPFTLGLPLGSKRRIHESIRPLTSYMKATEWKKPPCWSNDTDVSMHDIKFTPHIICTEFIPYVLNSSPCQLDVKLSNTR
jgi:hypothetical protein